MLSMRVIVQRVNYAKCHIDGQVYSEINHGFMILVGIKETDTNAEIEKVAKKVAGLRVFDDENGKMNLNLETVGGEILSISQFTLFADCKKGNRPSFVSAMKPPKANEMYEYFNTLLRNSGFTVKTGVFGGEMKIELINDGPITIFIDSDDLA